MAYPLRQLSILVSTTVLAATFTQTAWAQNDTWLRRPPVSIQGGDQFTVQWHVQDFDHPLTANAVAWSTTNLADVPRRRDEDRRDDEHDRDDDRLPGRHRKHQEFRVRRRDVPHQTPNQLNGNCAYEAVVTAPVVTTTQTMFFWAFTESSKEFAFTEPVPVLVTVGPATATYVPTETGRAWTYVRPGGSDPFTVAIPPHAGIVNCVPTVMLEDFTHGVRDHITVTPDGLFVHFVDQGDLRGTITYDPPLKIANPELVVGDVVTSTGTWTNAQPNGAVFVRSYVASTTVQAFESLTVPAGTFNVARLFFTLDLDGIDSDDFTAWVAPNVGIIKLDSRSNAGIGDRELVNTNLP